MRMADCKVSMSDFARILMSNLKKSPLKAVQSREDRSLLQKSLSKKNLLQKPQILLEMDFCKRLIGENLTISLLEEIF